MFSFVVLHYGKIDNTITCLNYLKKIIKDSHIILVDNHSLTKAETDEIRQYTNDILIMNQNYGFAKANNMGISYAMNKYHSDFYIVINNDVFINQPNFLNIILEDYNKYKFDLLGPHIKSESGESVNPFPVFKNKEEVNSELFRSKLLLKIYNNIILFCILKVMLKIKHIIKKPIPPKNGKVIKKNVALHGCAIIMSYKYVKKYDYPFYNDTFLFHEEEFLYQRILKDNLVSIYDPHIKVFHKEGSSLEGNGKREKLVFITKERIKSLTLLEKTLR